MVKNRTQSTICLRNDLKIKNIKYLWGLLQQIQTITKSKNSKRLDASETVKTESVCKIRIFSIKMEINPPLLIANLYQPSSFISVPPDSSFNKQQASLPTPKIPAASNFLNTFW